MPWLQLTFTVPRALASGLTEALEANGALAVSIEGADRECLLQIAREQPELWDLNQVAGLFPESADVCGVVDRLRAALGAGLPEHRIDTLPDDDWVRAWMARYQPRAVAPGLWICPTWCAPLEPEAVNILLDPGVAFGTGDHPTTALALEWLARQRLADRTLIDYGCGSGILAVAGLKLGARHAYAVDIDPLALTASRENAARNQVAERMTAVAPEALAPAPVDIVIANILARPLIELAPRLSGLVRAGGAIALTGILAEQADEVRTHYAARFAFETRQRAEWILLAGVEHGEG